MHPRFHAHPVTCDRCAFRAAAERNTRPRLPRPGEHRGAAPRAATVVVFGPAADCAGRLCGAPLSAVMISVSADVRDTTVGVLPVGDSSAGKSFTPPGR
jgi:hypothetical protein